MPTGNTKKPRDQQHRFWFHLHEEDVRLIHNAVDFYLKNRPGSGERPEHMQEPTAHVKYMIRQMDRMLMESRFRDD